MVAFVGIPDVNSNFATLNGMTRIFFFLFFREFEGRVVEGTPYLNKIDICQDIFVSKNFVSKLTYDTNEYLRVNSRTLKTADHVQNFFN